jgi:hypothetical protein
VDAACLRLQQPDPFGENEVKKADGAEASAIRARHSSLSCEGPKCHFYWEFGSCPIFSVQS